MGAQGGRWQNQQNGGATPYSVWCRRPKYLGLPAFDAPMQRQAPRLLQQPDGREETVYVRWYFAIVRARQKKANQHDQGCTNSMHTATVAIAPLSTGSRNRNGNL